MGYPQNNPNNLCITTCWVLYVLQVRSAKCDKNNIPSVGMAKYTLRNNVISLGLIHGSETWALSNGLQTQSLLWCVIIPQCVENCNLGLPGPIFRTRPFLRSGTPIRTKINNSPFRRWFNVIIMPAPFSFGSNHALATLFPSDSPFSQAPQERGDFLALVPIWTWKNPMNHTYNFLFTEKLTLSAAVLRLLSSKVQGRKDVWKSSTPCHADIHWIALDEHYQMSTVFQPSRSVISHVVASKSATSNIRVKIDSICYKCVPGNRGQHPFLAHSFMSGDIHVTWHNMGMS